DPAPPRRCKTHDGFHCRRFARTISPEERHGFALAHREADAEQDLAGVDHRILDLGERRLRRGLAARRGARQQQAVARLARARAVGRRGAGQARTPVWDAAKSVMRAVERLYPDARFDLDGSHDAQGAIERQDLDDLLGNLIENAAKYGGGS
ncbi:hypothetical protein KXV85_004724, partial [Aspergillus fumigatus]